MAANGVNGVQGLEGLQWFIGLKNNQQKYLTAESFGFKINGSGTSLRKKQVWTLEIDDKEDVVYLRSHLGRYLASTEKGKVSCDSETREENTKFVIEYCKDGSGRWTFRSHAHGYFFGGAVQDDLICYAKIPAETEFWTVQLAIHPQVILRNYNRKRYAHLNEEADEIQCNELIPWGQDALITLDFLEGKYALRAFDNRYLHREGKLVKAQSPDTLYVLQIKSGQHAGLAFKDCQGKYLTAVGPNGTLKTRNKTITKDELFTIEDSHPQATFQAHNSKLVSIKQGIDVSANQEEVTDSETFQLEYNKQRKQWRIRTVDNKFFSLENASGIQATATEGSGENTHFDFEWQDDGAIAMKANNGKYLTARMNGSLYAVSDSVTDKERFVMTLVNRPILVLKGEYGFVGFKSSNSTRMECNKSVYDIIYLEHGESGTYYFKGTNGKYWAVAGDGTINADSDQPHPFILEFRGPSRFTIKAISNGQYIRGEQNGIFNANSALEKATLWEY